jgi:hypothetical protein
VPPPPGGLAARHRLANNGEPGREAWEFHNLLIYRGMTAY